MGMTSRLPALAAAFALALLLAVFAPGGRAMACSCAVVGPDEALATAHVAFVGVVAQVHDSVDVPLDGGKGLVDPLSTLSQTVVVEEMLKGAGSAGDQLLVFSDLGTCGMAFDVGQRWRLFAYTDGGRLLTGICSGNELLAEQAPVPAVAEPPPAPPPIGVLLAIGGVAVLTVVSALAFTRGAGSKPHAE